MRYAISAWHGIRGAHTHDQITHLPHHRNMDMDAGVRCTSFEGYVTPWDNREWHEDSPLMAQRFTHP